MVKLLGSENPKIGPALIGLGNAFQGPLPALQHPKPHPMILAVSKPFGESLVDLQMLEAYSSNLGRVKDKAYWRHPAELETIPLLIRC